MDQATVDLGQVLVDTQDYYGWHVLPDDNLYRKLADESKNVSDIEAKEIDQVTKYIDDNRLAVEVGCHYGFTTAALSQRFDEVHSFDFDNDVHKCFQMNMQKFDLDNVVIHSHGLGNQRRNVAVTQDRGPLSLGIDPVKSWLGEDISQRVDTLDSLELPYCDLLCIDTEGYESMVIDGALQTIQKHRPVIVAELHRKQQGLKFGVNNDTLHKKILGLGYHWITSLNKHDRVYKPKALKRKITKKAF
jgi:FkbM family methyltransferase